MKRRKNAYGGESKIQKLAKDIYSLAQVLEGAEFNEIRDILSTSNHKSTNLDSSILNSGITNNSEIECLKTVINSMKADILALKQKNIDLDSNLKEEIKKLHESVKSIQTDLQMSDMREKIRTNAQSIDRIVDDRSNGNASLKSEIRLLKDDIKDIQDNLSNKAENKRIETLNEKHAQLMKRVGKLEKSDKNNTNLINSSSGKQSEKSEADNSAQNSSTLEKSYTNDQTTPDNTIETIDRSYAEVLLIQSDPTPMPTQRRVNQHSASRSHAEVQLDLTEQVSPRINRRNDYHRESQDELSADVDRRAPTYTRPRNDNGGIQRGRGSNRSVNDKSNANKSTVENDENDDDGNFDKYVRRRVKRFYVGGFNNTITTDKLISYVEKRGVTVTWVTIFPMRRSHRVLIRLNVEDNDNSDFVLNNTFWPRHVMCKLWMTKNVRERLSPRDNNRHNEPEYDNNDRYQYNEHDDDYYNDNRNDNYDKYSKY